MAREEKSVNGLIYYREPDMKLWKVKDRRQSSPDAPHVLCECGSSTFVIRYDYYECRGRCSVCGCEDELYSG